MKSKFRAVLMSGLGTVLSMSVAASASADVSHLEVESGTIGAKGLQAVVPVTVVCTDGAQFQGTLTLQQVAQQKTITGGTSGFGGPTCTGEPQTVTVQVRPLPKPFKKGPALADVFVSSHCFNPESGEQEFCGALALTEEIRLS